MTGSEPTETVRLRLVAETAEISKRSVETDRVSVRTVLDERDAVFHEDLRRETLRVERRPVEFRVDAAPPPREENGATVISIVEERAVVTKVLFVVEEVVIHRAQTVEPVDVVVRLRAMRAVIDQDAPALPPTPSHTPPQKDED